MSPVSAVCQGDVTACQADAYLTPATAAAQTLLTSIYQNTTGHLHAATEIFKISFFRDPAVTYFITFIRALFPKYH